jgi:O-antigen ligase
MKTGSGLFLIGAGAILAFAVTANTSFFNLHTAGWVLMVIGVLGIAVPRRAAGWVGRRLFVRRYETAGSSTAKNVTYPSYVTRSPDTTPVRAGLPAGRNDQLSSSPAEETEVMEDIYEE